MQRFTDVIDVHICAINSFLSMLTSLSILKYNLGGDIPLPSSGFYKIAITTMMIAVVLVTIMLQIETL